MARARPMAHKTQGTADLHMRGAWWASRHALALLLLLLPLLPSCTRALRPGITTSIYFAPGLKGQDLLAAMVRNGVFTPNDTNPSSEQPLWEALKQTEDSIPATYKLEFMMGRFIWTQQPQRAIETSFSSFFPVPASAQASSSSHNADNQSANGQPGLPKRIQSADPSLWQAVHTVLNAPQSINESFLHINELGYSKVWLAVAQIQAISVGAGACLPAAGVTPEWLSSMMTDTTLGQQEGPGPETASQTLTQDSDANAQANSVCNLEDELKLLRFLITKMPKQYGLALLRRMTVAALLQRRTDMNRALNAKEERQAILLLLQLYVVHREAAMKKAVVEFFHISKAGGTSMCSLSQRNGCSTWDAGEKRNCLVYEFDDLPHWVSRQSHKRQGGNSSFGAWFLNYESERNQVSCARRRQFLKQKGWEMYAHEFTLVGGRRSAKGVQLCTEMVTLLQMRHPYTRLVSHLRWVYGLYHERQSRFGNPVEDYWPNTTSAHWQFMTPAVVDNYYTRSLLGEAVYRMPVNGVTEAHGKMAGLLVAQYDVLLLLEQAGSRRLQLNMGLGWKYNEQERQRSADDLMRRVQATNDQASSSNQTTSSGASSTTSTASSSASWARRLGQLSEGQSTLTQGSAAAMDRAKHLVKTAESEGVPKDLGVLLAANHVDLELYQFASWLSRFDALVLDLARLVLKGDPLAGLSSEPDAVKMQQRKQARERKWYEYQRQQRLALKNPAIAAAAAATPSAVLVPVDDSNTCGFAGH